MFGYFENLVDPFKDERSAGHTCTIYGFISKQIYGLRKYMFLVALCSMCTAATEVYIFKFLGSLVDAMESTDNFFVDNTPVIAQMCLILLVGLPLVASAHTLFWSQTLEGNFPVRMMSNAHQYLMKQSLTFYQTEAAGKISNTLLQTAVSTRLIILKLIDTFMFALVFFMSMAFMLSGIDPYLLIPVAFWFIGYVLVIIYFVPKLKAWSNKQASVRSEMVGQLVDTYTNIATVKLFSHASTEKDYANSYMSRYLDSIKGQMRFISKVQFLMWGLNIMLIFSTIVLSLSLWDKGLISVGAIAAAVGVAFRVYTMSHWIMWEVSGFFGNLGIVQDGIKLLSRPLPRSSVEEGGPLNIDRYNISFKNVCFSYNDRKKIIKNFSLSIAAGEKIGIIGCSGSGKSTLAKLLLRFYELDNGEIALGGINIQSVNHESLLEKIAVVTQDVELLDRSVRENLIYGNNQVSETEMIDAAKAAGAHGFIINLVDENGRRGYDARIGVRGGMLSGGQRQRISFARALIKDSPIIIFDEATSALDSEIESHIMNRTSDYIAEKTVIMIAHRLTTLARMDRLAIIEKGELVELGTHEELKARRGIYFRMLSMQSDKILDTASLVI